MAQLSGSRIVPASEVHTRTIISRLSLSLKCLDFAGTRHSSNFVSFEQRFLMRSLFTLKCSIPLVIELWNSDGFEVTLVIHLKSRLLMESTAGNDVMSFQLLFLKS